MKYINEVSTPIFLQDKLTQMKEKIIKNNRNVEYYRQNAQLIENFLNEIGNNKDLPNNIIDGISQQQIKEAIDQLHLGRNYWSFIGKKGSAAYGVKFEEYFSNLLNRIMENAKEQGIAKWEQKSPGVINVGGKTVDPMKNIIDKMADEITINLMEEAYKEIGIELDKQSKDAEIKNHTLNKVQGKIDTATRFLNFEVIVDNPALQRILPLLANATFSDKAYLTAGDVKIGQTNSFRVFLAVTGDLTAKEKLHYWYKMLQCMDDHSIHNSAELFYQMRYIYELTGYGLQYTEQMINEALGNNTGADYFIYFHEGKVKVVASAAVFYDFLESIEKNTAWQGKTLHGGNITKNYALYAKLKMRMRAGHFELGEY